MNMDQLTKSVEKINLKKAMTLDELYDLMMKNSTELPGKFKLKKGMMGKSILFDVKMQMQPRITVKDNLVTIRKMGKSTKVGMGEMPSMDFKDLKQRTKAVKEGGFKKAVTGSQDYFVEVCDSMVELLASYSE